MVRFGAIDAASVEIDGTPSSIQCACNIGCGVIAYHHNARRFGTANLHGVVVDSGAGFGDAAILAQDNMLDVAVHAASLEFKLLHPLETIAYHVELISLVVKVLQ